MDSKIKYSNNEGGKETILNLNKLANIGNEKKKEENKKKYIKQQEILENEILKTLKYYVSYKFLKRESKNGNNMMSNIKLTKLDKYFNDFRNSFYDVGSNICTYSDKMEKIIEKVIKKINPVCEMTFNFNYNCYFKYEKYKYYLDITLDWSNIDNLKKIADKAKEKKEKIEEDKKKKEKEKYEKYEKDKQKHKQKHKDIIKKKLSHYINHKFIEKHAKKGYHRYIMGSEYDHNDDIKYFEKYWNFYKKINYNIDDFNKEINDIILSLNSCYNITYTSEIKHVYYNGTYYYVNRYDFIYELIIDWSDSKC